MKKIRYNKIGGAMIEIAVSMAIAVPLVTLIPNAWHTISVYDELEYVACTAARYASLQDPGVNGSLNPIKSATTDYLLDDLIPSTSFARYYAKDPSIIDLKINYLIDYDNLGNISEDKEVSPGDIFRLTVEMDVNDTGQFHSFFIDGGHPDELERSCTFTHIGQT